MGGAVSVSNNNDDMVTKLINAQYIKTPCVERAFRSVDRGNYVLHKDSAYSDSAWRTDHLHLSAPCIYAQVLEGLLLEPGQRFLNIGSGTGYLSTMVAMILGSEGTNHGVELRPEVIRYAHLRMKSFKKCSAYNPDFFADPVFIEGNAYHLMPPETKYDRIYCGAAVEPAFLDRLRDDFLNVGGVIVAPVQDELLQVYKESLRRDIVISLLDVSFSHLIRRTSPNARHLDQPPSNSVVLPLQHVQSLQEQCRARIVHLVKAKLLQERPTRGGVFAPVFASSNCPPLPLPSYTAKPQTSSSSSGQQQDLHDAIDRFISQEILGVDHPPNANESVETDPDRLSRSLSTSALAGEEPDAPAQPQSSVSGGLNGCSSRARSSSESAGQSCLIAEALGYRGDGKVVRICGKTLIASHSPCAVKRCGPPVNKHPPFRFRRPQFGLDGSFGNVDESDEDDAPTVISSSRPLVFLSDDPHSSATSSSSEDHDSLEESLARHRNVKAFNAAKKSETEATAGESNPTSSSDAAVSSVGESGVGGGVSSSSCSNLVDGGGCSGGGVATSTTEISDSFDVGVWETPSSSNGPISSPASSSNAADAFGDPVRYFTMNRGSESVAPATTTITTTTTTAALVGCFDNVDSRAHSTRASTEASGDVTSNRSLIDCVIDNCMGGGPNKSSVEAPDRNTRCTDDSNLQLPRRLSSDEEGVSDGGQSSDSSKSVGDSCARTKAVKRQSVDDPRGRANRCKRSNRRSSGRSEDTGSGSASSNPAGEASTRDPWSRTLAGTDTQRASIIAPSFPWSLDRLEAAEERVNYRSRARRLSVLSLLSRLASSYVDENHRQLRRHRPVRGQGDDAAQAGGENGGHQEIEVDEEGDDNEVEEEEADEEEEEEDSALSEDPSGDDVDDDVYMECGGGGGRRLFGAEEKNYVTSSDDEPEYFKEHFRRHDETAASAPSEQRQPEKQEQPQKCQQQQQQKRRKKRKAPKPELWVRGTGGFDSYLDYKNNHKPFCKLPREFRLEIRMLDRLHRLPLPPPIRDHLLLGNWTCKQVACRDASLMEDDDDEMESLC